ncbi:hypothetical protein NQ317_008770 [Molorchus minor]|uniref:DNA-directed DNA polymerase n=1 Tax=Molorchus minor TaxID=1323400 RepID=A0ABQ9IUH2_9CUCU|nr:hypothetical protein NQ317_008770 [Molorchus minor]
MYTDKNSLPHVQVALRYNQQSGGHFRAGDTVSYVICDDGSNKPATQRGYHIDELKNSETLKVDVQYYLAHQIHPVVTQPLLEQQVESGYHALRETVEKYLNHSGYSVISLTELFSGFMIRNKHPELIERDIRQPREFIEEDEDEEF